MERDECKAICNAIIGGYPVQFKGITVPEVTAMVNSYWFFLCDYDYNDVVIALKTFGNTSGGAFPPTAPQLVEMVHKPEEIAMDTDVDAWAKVRPMIRRGNYYAEEDFAKLPEDIQRCVGSAQQLRDWANLPSETIDSRIATEFKFTYRARVEKNKTLNRMPTESKLKIESIGKYMLEGDKR